MRTASDRAIQSLRALAIGDSFGELFFTNPATALVGLTPMPPAPWRWTDDTHMALSIVETLLRFGTIDQAQLALRFAERFEEEPNRGYAGGALHVLSGIAAGRHWSELAQGLFGGTGSYGNGAAMRVGPLGAFFADDLSLVIKEATRSAQVTHAHEAGIAGAVAVAIAAALRWSDPAPTGSELLQRVVEATPDSRTADRLKQALTIDPADISRAAVHLGTGDDVAAWDTVPFCVWMAAHHGADFEFVMRATAGGMGDRDTTCAIVAGILAPDRTAIPAAWLEAAEPVPDFA